MEMKYIEDFVVGEEEVIPAEYLVTKEEIIDTAKKWDPQPFHIDEKAAEESLFGGLVAASVHVFGICSWMGIHMERKWAALAALGFEEFRLPHPVRAGDRLKATSRCMSKRESKSRPDRGIVTSKMTLENQEGEAVVTLTSTSIISKRSAQRRTA
jgi:acyl dehydratase